MGAFIAALLPIALVKWSKWEAALVVLVCLACDSSMTIAAMLTGVTTYFWFKYTWRSLSIMVPMFLASFCFMTLVSILPNHDMFNINGRMLPWKAAWEAFLQRPSGWGPGAWLGIDSRWNINYHELYAQVHSDWLQLLFEGGVLTFGSFGLFIIRSLYNNNAVWSGVFVSLLVNSLANFPMRFAPTAFLFCLAVAMLYKGGHDTNTR